MNCCRYPCGMNSAGYCYSCNPPVYMLPPQPVFPPPGCVCPPTSEKTCEAPMCPRKNHLKANHDRPV